MDKFVRVYSGGAVVRGPNGVEFGSLAEEGLWFDAAPTFAQLHDAVFKSLGWNSMMHDVRVQGRMNVGGGAHRHFILVPINDDKSWSSYVKAVFNGTEWNCLEIYAEAMERSSVPGGASRVAAMSVDLPKHGPLIALKQSLSTEVSGSNGVNRENGKAGTRQGGKGGNLDMTDPHYYPLLVGPYDVNHRAHAISSGQTLPELSPRTYEPLCFDKRYVPYLRPAGLMGLANMCKAGLPSIDKALISALVDRWRPETHTFHMAFGEITITLQDVAMILGLPIAGHAVITGPQVPPRELFRLYLGKVPPEHKRYQAGVKISWLRSEFNNCPEDADDETVKRHARAYILSLISGVLFSDATGDVYSCLPFPLIVDLEHIGSYSWGSATLAYLYRALCDACMRHGEQSNVTGCLMFLQLWAWERFPVGRPELVNLQYPDVTKLKDERDKPTIGLRWLVGRSMLRAAPSRCYDYYMDEFDLMKDDQVVWYPYRLERVQELKLAPICTQDQHLWLTQAPLIYFNIVEVHTPERVMRQLGLHQEFPPPLRDTSEKLHRCNRRGKGTENWAEKHMTFVDIWEANGQHLLKEDRPYNQADYKAYMQWYTRSTRIRLCPPRRMQDNHKAGASGEGPGPAPSQLRYTPRAHLIHSVTDKLTILAKDAADKKRQFLGESRAFVERVIITCRDIIEELGGAVLWDIADVISPAPTLGLVAAEPEVDHWRDDEEGTYCSTEYEAVSNKRTKLDNEHDGHTPSQISQALRPTKSEHPQNSTLDPANITLCSKAVCKRKRGTKSINNK